MNKMYVNLVASSPECFEPNNGMDMRRLKN